MKRIATRIVLVTGCMLLTMLYCYGQKHKNDKTVATSFYTIRVYHFTTAAQEAVLDQYFAEAFVPALHKHALGPVGVFKPIANDTAADKRIVMIVAGESAEKISSLNELVEQDTSFDRASKMFVDAAYNEPAFSRYETILLKAFPLAKKLQAPALSSPVADHVYELRSYEGPTERLFRSKVQMFNEGGEIGIFNRLGFNAVFYGEVMSGSHMPNLMYMTCFENRAERDAHWKLFSADPEWKNLSALPQYQHTVSHADIILMKAAAYSDY